MNYIKKITLLCVPWLLAACGTIPISQPVEDATRPTVSEPQEKPIKAPEPLVTPQKAPVASAAQAPAVVLSLLRRAEQQGRVGKDAAAASSLERAIRIAPRYPESYYRLGELRYKEGRYSQAISLAQKTLSLGAQGSLRSIANALIAKAKAH